MPAPKKLSNLNAELDALKAKRQKLASKMDVLRDEMDELRGKMAEVDQGIFEREDGRLLRVVKQILENKDPQMSEFNEMVRSYMEREELDGTLPRIKVKGASKTGPIAKAIAANSGKPASATK